MIQREANSVNGQSEVTRVFRESVRRQPVIGLIKEPLNNSESPLRALRVADARRDLPQMAVALCKSRNAADAALRARPPGLSERSTLVVVAP